jgi:hypothetical protein
MVKTRDKQTDISGIPAEIASRRSGRYFGDTCWDISKKMAPIFRRYLLGYP